LEGKEEEDIGESSTNLNEQRSRDFRGVSTTPKVGRQKLKGLGVKGLQKRKMTHERPGYLRETKGWGVRLPGRKGKKIASGCKGEAPPDGS